MIKLFLAEYRLEESYRALLASNVGVARTKLDYVLRHKPESFPFILAYDALLMMQEDRHEEARQRFKECLGRYRSGSNANETYIDRFCEFHLASYNEEPNLASIRASALQLSAKAQTKKFLRFPSEEAIQRWKSRQ